MEATVILAPGRRSAFRYRIEGGMDERDRDEIDAMDSGYVLGMDWPNIVSDSVDIRHRVHYMRCRHLGFGQGVPCDPSFGESLSGIDPELPYILSKAAADLYLNGTRMLSDHAENLQSEVPRNSKPRGWCETALARLIGELSPGTPLEKCYMYRMPAGFEDNFEVSGSMKDGFYTALVFGIGAER